MQDSEFDADYLHLDHPDIPALFEILKRDGNMTNREQCEGEEFRQEDLLIGTMYAQSFLHFVRSMDSWIWYMKRLINNCASGFVHRNRVHVELSKLGFVADTAIGKAEFAGFIICCGPYIALRRRSDND
jgi:hypothetical protein